MASQSQEPQKKHRLLTQEDPSPAVGMADAIIIKDGELFFASQPDGGVPLQSAHGLGLYFHDCRYLSGYELKIGDMAPECLMASGESGFCSLFQLTNPEIKSGEQKIKRQRIGICWRHIIDVRNQAMRDEICIENYDDTPVDVVLQLRFQADFRDVFVIRGLTDERPGTIEPARWADDELIFAYSGCDQLWRRLHVRFSQKPDEQGPDWVSFRLRLKPRQNEKLLATFAVVETDCAQTGSHVRARHDHVADAEQLFERSISDWMTGFARVNSANPWVEKAVDRSLRDLRALRTPYDGHQFFAAGLPWFATLFGRDSIICALQTLAYRSETAAETLELLAEEQGKRHDAEREEEPGKILHELRSGELARAGFIPYTPYYGTVDATPLFLILLAEYVRWTGDVALFRKLRQSANAALHWIDEIGDHDGDGYLDYSSPPGDRLINQGWKDSGTAIVDAEGKTAEPPIILCEVQGYAYRAKRAMAWLLDLVGEKQRASELRTAAEELRTRFNHDFWVKKQHFFALGLDGKKRQLAVISSNPGQALWSGVVADAHVKPLVERLMAPDMYSGWGVRTLCSSERAYNPIGYHLGTVWPHDNAFIVSAFRRSGHDTEACRIFASLLEASTYFPECRLPEVFAGYDRATYGLPVHYPVACHPQAWAAGSIPYMLQELLGFEPDATRNTLRIVRPVLPAFIEQLHFQRLRVGNARLDVLFERDGKGGLSPQVKVSHGRLDVQICDQWSENP